MQTVLYDLISLILPLSSDAHSITISFSTPLHHEQYPADIKYFLQGRELRHLFSEYLY